MAHTTSLLTWALSSDPADAPADSAEQGSSSRSAPWAPANQRESARPTAATPVVSALVSPSAASKPVDSLTGQGIVVVPPAAASAPSRPAGALDGGSLAQGRAQGRDAGKEDGGRENEGGRDLSLSSFLDTDIFYAQAPLTKVALTTTTASTDPLLVQGNGTNISFRLSWDSSVANAPSAFTSTIGTMAQKIADSLTAKAPVTINLQIGWGSLNNSALPSGALGASSTYIYSYGSGGSAYNYYRGLLEKTSSGSVIDTAELAKAVPSTMPISSTSKMLFTSAQGKALGALSGSQTSLDGYIGFAATNYLQTSGSGYDLTGVAVHEITESMGRIMNSGSSSGYTNLDLMHYNTTSSRGVTRMLTSKGGYLSADGVNKLVYLNGQSSGDAADWASPTASKPNLGADCCNAFASPGATSLSPTDWFAMDSLGWNLASGSGLTTTSVPKYLA